MVDELAVSLVALCAVLSSCSEPPIASEARNEPNAIASADVPNQVILDAVDALAEPCVSDLRHWRRLYFYKLNPATRDYNRNVVVFSFRKGSYPDLKPGVFWKPIEGETNLDDRPQSIVTGEYDLRSKTGSVMICDL